MKIYFLKTFTIFVVLFFISCEINKPDESYVDKSLYNLNETYQSLCERKRNDNLKLSFQKLEDGIFNLGQEISESDDITYFQFIKKNNRDVGPVVVGLEVKNENDVQSIKLKMNEKGFQFEYLNENDPLLALLI